MNWFTPERRMAIQAFLGTLAPLLILFGFGTEDTWEQVLIITGAVLVFIAAVLNVINLQWREGWAVLRGAIYTLAGIASPALVALGLYDADTNTALLTGLSLGLAALNSLLSIFTNAKQQIAVRDATIEVLELPEPKKNPGYGDTPGDPIF